MKLTTIISAIALITITTGCYSPVDHMPKSKKDMVSSQTTYREVFPRKSPRPEFSLNERRSTGYFWEGIKYCYKKVAKYSVRVESKKETK